MLSRRNPLFTKIGAPKRSKGGIRRVGAGLAVGAGLCAASVLSWESSRACAEAREDLFPAQGLQPSPFASMPAVATPKPAPEPEPSPKAPARRPAERKDAKKKAVVKKNGDKKKKKSKKDSTPDPTKELLHKGRVLFLNGRVDDTSSMKLITNMLYLNQADPKAPITLVINSGGGTITSGMGIYDVMQFIDAPVRTVVIGRASSMAAILLAAGEPGQRMAMPHARIMVHEASSAVARHQVQDVIIRAKELTYKNDLLIKVLAKHTGYPESDIRPRFERDFYMDPSEAVKLGIVDKVVGKADKLTWSSSL